MKGVLYQSLILFKTKFLLLDFIKKCCSQGPSKAVAREAVA